MSNQRKIITAAFFKSCSLFAHEYHYWKWKYPINHFRKEQKGKQKNITLLTEFKVEEIVQPYSLSAINIPLVLSKHYALNYTSHYKCKHTLFQKKYFIFADINLYYHMKSCSIKPKTRQKAQIILFVSRAAARWSCTVITKCTIRYACRQVIWILR